MARPPRQPEGWGGNRGCVCGQPGSIKGSASGVCGGEGNGSNGRDPSVTPPQAQPPSNAGSRVCVLLDCCRTPIPSLLLPPPPPLREYAGCDRGLSAGQSVSCGDESRGDHGHHSAAASIAKGGGPAVCRRWWLARGFTHGCCWWSCCRALDCWLARWLRGPGRQAAELLQGGCELRCAFASASIHRPPSQPI